MVDLYGAKDLVAGLITILHVLHQHDTNNLVVDLGTIFHAVDLHCAGLNTIFYVVLGDLGQAVERVGEVDGDVILG